MKTVENGRKTVKTAKNEKKQPNLANKSWYNKSSAMRGFMLIRRVQNIEDALHIGCQHNFYPAVFTSAFGRCIAFYGKELAAARRGYTAGIHFIIIGKNFGNARCSHYTQVPVAVDWAR